MAADYSDDSRDLLPTGEPVDSHRVIGIRSYQRYLVNWRYSVVVGAPVVFSPLLFLIGTKPAKAGYVVCLMAVYWMAEACPIAATALLPIVLFPLLGVMDSTRTCSNYLRDGNALFLAGLIVAVAFEKWNLHKRIALRVLLLAGTKPRWVLLGFMGTTAFLSMWISNTATTAMMLPIAQAVLNELEGTSGNLSDNLGSGNQEDSQETNIDDPGYNNSIESQQHQQSLSNSYQSVGDVTVSPLCSRPAVPDTCDDNLPRSSESHAVKHSKVFRHLAKALMLGIAYAANLGGTATLTGTGPNIVLRAEIDRKFPSGPGIDFGNWFLMAFPNMLLLLTFAWGYLCLIYFKDWRCCYSWKLAGRLCCLRKATYLIHGNRVSSGVQLGSSNAVIREQYKRLGPIKFAEVAVLVDFIVLALMWLTRGPLWSDWFARDENCQSFVTDTTVAMLMCFILFVFPSRWRISSGTQTEGSDMMLQPVPRLLDWKTVEKNLPWGIIILMGGGFAMADGCEVSGLSEEIGYKFKSLVGLSTAAIAIIVSAVVALVTEVTANVATTTLFLPILSDVAVGVHLNPLYLMIPATIAASFAFMLPVATPPNAMVFSSGHLKVFDMVKAGFVMNIVSVLVTSFTLNTIGLAVFDLDSFPLWANATSSNRTC